MRTLHASCHPLYSMDGDEHCEVGPSDSPEQAISSVWKQGSQIEPKIDMMRRPLVQTSQVDNMGKSIGYPLSRVDLAFVLDI